MADNEQLNDEYQFADLDGVPPDAPDELGEPPISPLGGEERRMMGGVDKNVIIRNSLIVVGIVIVIMIIYKVVGTVASEKSANSKHVIVPAPVMATPVVSEPALQPVVPSSLPVAPSANADTSKMAQQLSALEVSQQSTRQDVASLTDQVSGINTNMNTIVQKLSDLTNAIASLSARVDEQAHEVETLTIHRTAKHHHPVGQRARHQFLKYYIQAVIPGRAWLIASNGTTLTVREGTVITGLGMVKLIDPAEGRVVLSSGQVIKFSQEDS